MAAVQVAGLAPDELARALAYEVEPFSGIPVQEADVVFEPVAEPDSSVRVYDVVVSRKGRRSGVGGAARALKWLLAAGILALCAAAADFFLLSSRLRALEGELARRGDLQAQIDALMRPAASARAEAQAVRARRAAAAKAQDGVATRRAVVASAMRAMAESCGDKAVLRTFRCSADEIKMRCIAASASDASDASVALASRLGSLGWRLVPGAMEVKSPGMTAEFECEARHD